MASKRKALCVDQKVALIRAIENGEKKSDVGKRFGFSPSTVATIWKNKDKILHAETEGTETIRHSFRHAGLRSFANAEEEIEQFENEDDTLSEWIAQFNTPHTFTPEDLQNYVEIDENLVTTISLTDEEILNAVTKGEEEQKEDEEEAQPDEVVIPSIQQALDAAKLLEKTTNKSVDKHH
ncbi:hypothetical protein ACI65C_013496 [Semiaphis heraclei]